MTDSPPYKPRVERRAQTLDVRGVEYSINEWGDKDAPLIVYLHGWADTGSTFQFVVDAFTNQWRVVAPDWRGFGRSARSGLSYWFPDYLADLDDILARFSPDRPVVLIGHSMGGNVGSLYAGTMPERVSTLINIEGFGLSDSDPGEAPARYRQWLQANRERPVFSSYPDIHSLSGRIRKRNPGLDAAQADYVAREWADTDGERVQLRADPNHKLPNPVLYRRREAEACWGNISARTLLVYGDQSPFGEQHGSVSELPFPNCQIEVITGVGHMLHFDAPGRLARLLEQFLTKPL